MTIITYSKTTGDIFAFAVEMTPAEFAKEDANYANMVADIPFGATNYYVKNGQVTIRTPRPSVDYIWNGYEWVIDTPYAGQIVRLRRNQLLTDSDWTDTLSAKARLGEAKYNEWQVYRQALRDITAQPNFPTDVTWPSPPV